MATELKSSEKSAVDLLYELQDEEEEIEAKKIEIEQIETKRIEAERILEELTKKKAILSVALDAAEQKRLTKVAEIEKQRKEEENQRNTNLQEKEEKDQ